jgi:hypothetical protein
MDAVVPQDVRHDAYGQAVWSCPANAGDKLVEMRFRPSAETPRSIGDGGNKLVRRGERGASRKAIAQGVPE